MSRIFLHTGWAYFFRITGLLFDVGGVLGSPVSGARLGLAILGAVGSDGVQGGTGVQLTVLILDTGGCSQQSDVADSMGVLQVGDQLVGLQPVMVLVRVWPAVLVGLEGFLDGGIAHPLADGRGDLP